MKNIFICLITITAIAFAGCKGNSSKKNTESNENQNVETKDYQNTNSEIKQPSYLLTATDLPQEVDLNQDISQLSLQELNLLRNYVFATHGLYFIDSDLYSYFSANTKWYEKLIYALYYDGEKTPMNYSQVKLSADEKAFVGKIDKRIAEIQDTKFVQQSGYKLGNIDNIVNLFKYKDIDAEFLQKLSENNFVITTDNALQLFHLYEENDYNKIPSFITTDLYLQAFHMFFSYTLKSLEQQKFIPILSQICKEIHSQCLQIAATNENDEIKELALYNATFYSIPYYLLTGEKLNIPEKYTQDFEAEINNINKQEDNFSKFMSYTDVYFPYSLFKPRGHYTRKPQMEAYFKAMMWLQTAPFCRDNKEQLKQAAFTATLINSDNLIADSRKTLKQLYNSVYEPVTFLIGEADNLSIMDIADFLAKENINGLDASLSPETLKKVDNMLIHLSTYYRNRIKPEVEVSCPDKINFMPQRYLLDNDIIQKLVDVSPNSERAYPKGLDVFAALGSVSATDLLNNFYNENSKWNKYAERMTGRKEAFAGHTEEQWNKSVYNKWIESLLALQKTDKNYPEFMQTKTWGYKNLNTSLASWAELKHDAILYGEQPMAAECGGGGEFPPPYVKGYIEPNLQFWNKLAELVKLTEDMLKKNGLLTDDLKGKTEQLTNYTDFLIKATKKQLAKQELTDNEYYSIEYMGSSIEHFTLSVIDPDLYLDNWSLVKGPDKSIAVVADIYTRNVQDCDKNGILHVATGNANSIYVVVEIGGYLYLTRGATFSYYEFVQPLGTRLTDEEWQKMLERKKAPAIPEWMKGIVVDKEPTSDERMFYSSGC